jgi:hypothetical protein
LAYKNSNPSLCLGKEADSAENRQKRETGHGKEEIKADPRTRVTLV